jgi:hypothetical protein
VGEGGDLAVARSATTSVLYNASRVRVRYQVMCGGGWELAAHTGISNFPQDSLGLGTYM